jgi:hypothetical protein
MHSSSATAWASTKQRQSNDKATTKQRQSNNPFASGISSPALLDVYLVLMKTIESKPVMRLLKNWAFQILWTIRRLSKLLFVKIELKKRIPPLNRQKFWMRSLISIYISVYRKLEIYQYSSRNIESVLFTLFSPYLRYYQPILPTTQSSGWYYRRSGRSMYPSCLKMSSGAGGPSDIPETPGTYSSTFAVPPLRLRRSGEIPLVATHASKFDNWHDSDQNTYSNGWIMAIQCRYGTQNAQYDTVRWASPYDVAMHWVSQIQVVKIQSLDVW